MATRPPSTLPSWHSHPSSALSQRRRGLLADVRVSVMLDVLFVVFVVFVVVAVLRSLEGQSRPPDAEVERVHAADAGAWQHLGPVAFVFVLGFPDPLCQTRLRHRSEANLLLSRARQEPPRRDYDDDRHGVDRCGAR